MKIYSIFDDFDKKAIRIIENAGDIIKVHPTGAPRPDDCLMQSILEEYDCIIIGTSQKISEDMLENICTPKIIATASVGLDHIRIPDDKKHLVTVLNTPKANAQSVAEYTICCALACSKRIIEGNLLYRSGKTNKSLFQKPEDLSGKTIGVIGAGNVSVKIMEYALFLGMSVICWTRNIERHRSLEKNGIQFVELKTIAEESDVISVNLPNTLETKGLISRELVSKMKDNVVFISVSRLETVDIDALFEKAKEKKGFYVCLDIDVDEDVVKQIPEQSNVLITPHIAGGTIETRKRMFCELAEQIVNE